MEIKAKNNEQSFQLLVYKIQNISDFRYCEIKSKQNRFRLR